MSIYQGQVILIDTNNAIPVQNEYHLVLIDTNVLVPAGSQKKPQNESFEAFLFLLLIVFPHTLYFLALISSLNFLGVIFFFLIKMRLK